MISGGSQVLPERSLKVLLIFDPHAPGCCLLLSLWVLDRPRPERQEPGFDADLGTTSIPPRGRSSLTPAPATFLPLGPWRKGTGRMGAVELG